jgi:hypothetical protein
MDFLPQSEVRCSICSKVVDSWIQWMENQGFSPPAFIRMDNELVTNEMKEYCLSKGIIYKARTHQSKFPLAGFG